MVIILYFDTQLQCKFWFDNSNKKIIIRIIRNTFLNFL